MSRVIVIAGRYDIVRNWARAQGMTALDLDRLIVHVGNKQDLSRVQGLKRNALNYVILDAVNASDMDEIIAVMRIRGWDRLPVGIDDWPVEVFRG